MGLIWWLISVGFAQSVEEPFVVGAKPQTFWSIGGTTGGAVSDDWGGFVGLETGLSTVKGNRLLGVQSDLFYDTTQQNVVASIGPKVGVLMLNVDGGLAVSSNLSDITRVGGYGRLSMNFGVFAGYYRFNVWGEDTLQQFGISIKVPQLLGYQPRMEYAEQ